MTDRRRVPKIGLCILFPVTEQQSAYLHYIGAGIYGDAFRVLEGLYREPLNPAGVAELAARPESFIAQSFVLDVLDVPGTELVTVVTPLEVSELAPWWISSPIPDRFEDRWVIGIDRSAHYRMTDFVRVHPEVDATNLPETAMYGEGVLQRMIRDRLETGKRSISLYVAGAPTCPIRPGRGDTLRYFGSTLEWTLPQYVAHRHSSLINVRCASLPHPNLLGRPRRGLSHSSRIGRTARSTWRSDEETCVLDCP